MENRSKIILGDVHGCYLTLIALIEKLPKDVEIVISGDLVDRGPRSKEVVQYCMDNKIKVTKGNHEQMMIDSLNSDNDMRNFISSGGKQTLESYGATVINTGIYTFKVEWDNPANEEIFLKHIEWIKQLPAYLEFEDVKNSEGRKLVVSHSSVNSVWKHKDKTKTDREQHLFEQNIIWNRDVKRGGIDDVSDIYNVFGHTVMNKPRIRVPFAGIDTGCVFKDPEDIEEGYGKLTSLQYPEMIIVQQENVDE